MEYPFKEPYLSILMILTKNPGLNSNNLTPYLKNKKQSIIYRQLKQLEKDNYIKNKSNNRNFEYYVNFKELNDTLNDELGQYTKELEIIIEFFNIIILNRKMTT